MTKRCGRCGETKPVAAFHRWKRGGHQPWCKECRRAYDADYFQRNRERRKQQKARWEAEFGAWYRSLKTGRPCTDCGRIFDPAAMQWDHLPGGEKGDNLGNLGRRWNRRRVLEEIAKCELVCANCHAVRTVSRRNGA